jgi:hypothetical protein
METQKASKLNESEENSVLKPADRPTHHGDQDFAGAVVRRALRRRQDNRIDITLSCNGYCKPFAFRGASLHIYDNAGVTRNFASMYAIILQGLYTIFGTLLRRRIKHDHCILCKV